MSSQPLPVRAAPRTRLVCTVGPATDDRISELVAAGVDIIRLNLAHGTVEEHAARVRRIRDVSRDAGREVAVLADLPGPKVRLGALAGGAVELRAGETLTLVPDADGVAPGDEHHASTTHPGLASDLRPGDHVHLSDGAVELVVTACPGPSVETVVERGGRIRSGAGVNVPAQRLSLPVLGERDVALARLAREIGVDFVGQSFVRTAADVHALRALLGVGGPGIVAKIETRPAVDGFTAIAAASDGVMIARGDLGLDLPFESVPLVQKDLIAKAVAMGRPVIVATQMLESMTTAPRPTRAEASDVANAVLDGADAVMLSGETAIGRFPLLAVEAALRICAAAEEGVVAVEAVPLAPDGTAHLDAIARAAVALADADPEVTALLVVSSDLRLVRAVAARRPRVAVVAVVPDAARARGVLASRGVTPVVPTDLRLAEDDERASVGELLSDPGVRALLRPGAPVVLLAAGTPGAGGRIELATALPVGSDAA